MDFTGYLNNVFLPLGLSFICGLISALVNIPWGIFWGWVLARKQFPGKSILQTLLYLPLVLPPVLTGYLLLLVLGRKAWLGQWLYENFAFTFILNWKGAVLAAVIVGGPFMIESMRQAFSNIDERLEVVARGLGADFWKCFVTITMPLAKPSLLAGFFLVFARSMGEFGATLMIAGNIPGKTQNIPSAIFSQINSGTPVMGILVLISLIFSYAGLALSQHYHRKDIGK